MQVESDDRSVQARLAVLARLRAAEGDARLTPMERNLLKHCIRQWWRLQEKEGGR